MQFNTVRASNDIKASVDIRASAGIGKPPSIREPSGTYQLPSAASATQQTLVEGSKNLLKHIPGEASGFYLMAADSIQNPGLGTLILIFVLAFVLLVAVRWLAGASLGIMVTTIIAFVLWMLVLDKGLLNVAFPNLLADPLGLILAVFYSTLITILASAGKIR